MKTDFNQDPGPMALLRQLLLLSVFMAPALNAQTSANTSWEQLMSADGSAPSARHESGLVAVDGKLYLMGGRGNRPIEVYDPATRVWREIGPAPMELHHFQPVAVGTKIYVLAAFTCCFPTEDNVDDIHVFDTATESWSIEGKMPSLRVRGSAAAVMHDGMIYVVGGNTQGHDGGAVNWFDRFDPMTGDWEVLPDAPHARDHFSVVVVNNKLVAAAGRLSDLPNVFDKAVEPTNVFDFASGTWSVGADIPTLRAGALVGAAGNEIVVAGGEISGLSASLATTEAYDVTTDQWRALQPMNDARHSGGGVVLNGELHVVSGSLTRGGGGEFNSHEFLVLGDLVQPDLDRDNDGLTNIEEESIYNTDPDRADTDSDLVSDFEEVEIDSDPLNPDTDNDGLSDGSELYTYNSSPLLVDTDDDGLDDQVEALIWNTDPRLPDSDSDGLNDANEVSLGTSPTNADTDSDGLNDGTEVLAGTDPLLPDTDNDGLIDGEDPYPLEPESDGSEPVDPDPVDPEPVQASGGGAAMWLLIAIGVVGLSRRRLRSVNLSAI
ncbi:MAG: hypothetical protein AB8B79_08250 [Granulosicoccus sp.]